jgi:hypothetical protein
MADEDATFGDDEMAHGWIGWQQFPEAIFPLILIQPEDANKTGNLNGKLRRKMIGSIFPKHVHYYDLCT